MGAIKRLIKTKETMLISYRLYIYILNFITFIDDGNSFSLF
jgi:hypothetical protein